MMKKANRVVPDRDDFENDFKKINRDYRKTKKQQKKKLERDEYFEFGSGSEDSDSEEEARKVL